MASIALVLSTSYPRIWRWACANVSFALSTSIAVRMVSNQSSRLSATTWSPSNPRNSSAKFLTAYSLSRNLASNAFSNALVESWLIEILDPGDPITRETQLPWAKIGKAFDSLHIRLGDNHIYNDKGQRVVLQTYSYGATSHQSVSH